MYVVGRLICYKVFHGISATACWTGRDVVLRVVQCVVCKQGTLGISQETRIGLLVVPTH